MRVHISVESRGTFFACAQTNYMTSYMTWLIVRKELSGFFYHGLLILPDRSSHMSLPVSSDSSKRKIPPGLVELLEGFVLVVLRDKPEDLVQYASQYFSSAQTRKNSLKEHGASVEELGVDFFTATNWNGLVWLSKGFQVTLKDSDSLCENPWCDSCELYNHVLCRLALVTINARKDCYPFR